MTYVPDGATARSIAVAVSSAALQLDNGLSAAWPQVMSVLAGWNGLGRRQFESVLHPQLIACRGLIQSLFALSDDLGAIAHTLDDVWEKIHRAQKLELVGDIVTVAAVIQVGLDPVTDLGAALLRGGLAGGEAWLTETAALIGTRLVAAIASREAAALAVGQLARWATPKVAMAAMTEGLLEEILLGHVTSGGVAYASAFAFFPVATFTERSFLLRRLLKVFPQGLRGIDSEGNAGSHAVTRHVGLTDAELQARLGPRVRYATSFNREDDLDEAILETLMRNVDEVEAFRAGTDEAVYLTGPVPDGLAIRGWQRGRLVAEPIPSSKLHTVKVRLVRAPDGVIVIHSVFIVP